MERRQKVSGTRGDGPVVDDATARRAAPLIFKQAGRERVERGGAQPRVAVHEQDQRRARLPNRLIAGGGKASIHGVTDDDGLRASGAGRLGAAVGRSVVNHYAFDLMATRAFDDRGQTIKQQAARVMTDDDDSDLWRG